MNGSPSIPGPRLLLFLALGIVVLAGAIFGSLLLAPGLEKDQRTRDEVQADRLVSITPFRVDADGKMQPVQGTLGTDDRLLFAFNNGGKAFTHVAVLICDAQGGLHWYHPDTVEGAAVPMPQASRIGRLEPPIARQLPPGPAVLIGVFAHQALPAQDLERAARAVGTRLLEPHARLPVPNTGQHLTRLQVQ